MPDKPPFIASQRVVLLDADVDQPRQHLRPGLFRADIEKPDEMPKHDPTADAWQPISRRDLFLDHSIRRLCLTTDAGVGKTTALEWAEQEIGRHDAAWLAMYIELRHLPPSRRHYLEPAPDGTPAVLVEALMDRAGLDVDDTTGQRILNHLISAGRLVLLVDAIDQTLPDENVARKLQELEKFIRFDAGECRVVVAGRPYAIDRYWNHLFTDGPWRFAQVLPFTEDEQRSYLGDERYEHLDRLNVEVLAVPRALETIRTLKVPKLHELRTAGDLYWRAAERMLDEAFENAEVRRSGFTSDSALWLLAVLAFEMAREGNFAAVSRHDMPQFRRRVWDRHKGHCDWASQTEFNGQLRLLGKLNVFMDYAVTEDAELREILWKNRSLQEFFAGLWIASFASSDDRDWLGRCVYLPEDDKTSELEWTWRFAAEMHPDGRSPLCWVQSMAPLYKPGDGTPEGTRRSSEMLYRSWPTMEACARGEDEAAELAKSLLDGFQSEFRDQVLAGNRGSEAERIAEELVAKFRPIPPSVDSPECLRFHMGSPETEAERLDREAQHETSLDAQFEMACHQVTNEQYELFDPGHRKRRGEYSSEDRCPVIYVNWHDAWAFCRWLGKEFRLPTEKEWEFACRAGTTTAFHYGESLCSEQANFHGKYPYGGAKEGPYVGRTTAVGSYEPNSWGLFDMHGNVWEWCHTWYHENSTKSDHPNYFGSARVLRGGSWVRIAGLARSACCNLGLPTYSGLDVGFRVARALR